MGELLLLQKSVDKSLLTEGFSIPIRFAELFYHEIGFEIRHGEWYTIRIYMNGMEFDAVIRNQGFDRERYAGHKDVLQIRYGRNSELAREFRRVFAQTQSIIQNSLPTGGKHIKIAEEDREYIAVYSTAVSGTFAIECLTGKEVTQERQTIHQMDELALETMLTAKDDTAKIIESPGLRKIRHMSAAVSNALKTVYDYRCQICGMKIGGAYGSNLIHAHHIDYFSKSMNNDASNVMIVCPNHHGIIHDCNPKFESARCIFKYPNGYEEGLKLNRHLGKGTER